MALIVRRPGVCSLIVDDGRPGRQHDGVPLGGPADRSMWRIGNALVGNHEPAAALEITLQGPVLESTARHQLVIAGAPFQVQHHRAGKLHNSTIRVGHTFEVDRGDEVHIGGIISKAGLRAYVCVAGGFQTPVLLDSRGSMEPIATGSVLKCMAHSKGTRKRWIAMEPWRELPTGNRIRLMSGSHLTNKMSALLADARFTVRAESNRMGLRLQSSTTWPNEGKELLSAPVVPGTLQLPGGGQPILLGVDAQTIGGYPRLGHVISSDMDRVGQLKPGDHIRFSLVTLEEAERLEVSREIWLRGWLERLRWSA